MTRADTSAPTPSMTVFNRLDGNGVFVRDELNITD